MHSGPFDLPDLASALERIAQLEADNAALRASVDTRLSLARHVLDERSLLRTLIDNMPDQIYEGK